MDQNKELVFETKLVPEAWQDQKLIVSSKYTWYVLLLYIKSILKQNLQWYFLT